MEVFYNSSGNIISISKTIQLDALPVSAKMAFAKRYEGYTVKEAIHNDRTDEENYYVLAENEKGRLIINVDDNERLSIFKKSKK